MTLKATYLLLALLGTVFPYGALFPWLLDKGLNLAQLVNDILLHPVALMAWLDVIVSAIALLLFARVDSQRHQVPGFWLVVATTLSIGVSCGLPLYLYFREKALTPVR